MNLFVFLFLFQGERVSFNYLIENEITLEAEMNEKIEPKFAVAAKKE